METRAAVAHQAGAPLSIEMGTSTFANHTVLPEIALAKIREDAPFDKVCYIGCGVSTGIGAVINIVDWYMNGKIEIDPMITHTMALEKINDAFDLMHAGKSIRSVVTF